jgi:preprotein translocase subunit SecA
MNSQREVIYSRRRNALFGDKLSTDLANMVFDTAGALAEEFMVSKDLEAFRFSVFRVFAMELDSSAEELKKIGAEELGQLLYDKAMSHYTQRMERVAQMAHPVIKNVYENQRGQYENIVVPFTDGAKALQVVTNLQRAYESEGKEVVHDFEKGITLALIDDEWKDHLRKLDDLKQYVQGAVYEQKDPLLIYKFESFELFKGMVQKMNQDILSFLFKGSIPMQGDQAPVRQATAPRRKQEQLSTSGPGAGEAQGNGPRRPAKPKTVVKDKKYGRNDVVQIRNVSTGEQKSVKYKQAQPLIEGNQWILDE